MKKRVNIRNLIIVMLCITIVFMGIAFAYLSMRLSEQISKQELLEISITNIEEKTSIKGGITAPKATKELIDEGKTAKFHFTLNNPNDEIAYKLTIKNTGDVPAKIIRLISSPDYLKEQNFKSMIEPVVITHTNIENKKLKPNESIEVDLVITYNMSNNPKQICIPYQLTVLATNIKNKK